jgi:hypothetical protein
MIHVTVHADGSQTETDDGRPELVPQEVSPRQIRLALLAGGITPAFISAQIAAMPEPQRSAAQIEWEYATVIRRDHAMLNAMAVSMGMTDAQVDDLFRAAERIA